MDAGGECVVHALLQPLADDDPAGDDGVLLVGQQHLVQLLQGGDQVRPFCRVLERFQSLVDLGLVPVYTIDYYFGCLGLTDVFF